MTYKTKADPVPYELACRRVLAALKWDSFHRPSECANVIWPTHRMKAQGAAFAASRILKRMEQDKLIRWRWEPDRDRSGWCLPS